MAEVYISEELRGGMTAGLAMRHGIAATTNRVMEGSKAPQGACSVVNAPRATQEKLIAALRAEGFHPVLENERKG